MSGVVRVTKCFWHCPMSKAALYRIGGTASICSAGTASSTAGKAIGGPTIHAADDGPANEQTEQIDGSRRHRGLGRCHACAGAELAPAVFAKGCAAHRPVL